MDDFVSIDECLEILDEIILTVPRPLLEGLSGGINLSAKVKFHPKRVADDLYVMGEYIRDGIGSYIMIYYGSLKKVYPHLSRERLKEELEEIVFHELTHHIEYRAGERGLEAKDKADIEAYLSRHNKSKGHS